tara:strand:+ start:717 stop:872 length:156 start_codon:yes stop_codon:yes gene_type:complete
MPHRAAFASTCIRRRLHSLQEERIVTAATAWAAQGLLAGEYRDTKEMKRAP